MGLEVYSEAILFVCLVGWVEGAKYFCIYIYTKTSYYSTRMAGLINRIRKVGWGKSLSCLGRRRLVCPLLNDLNARWASEIGLRTCFSIDLSGIKLVYHIWVREISMYDIIRQQKSISAIVDTCCRNLPYVARRKAGRRLLLRKVTSQGKA